MNSDKYWKLRDVKARHNLLIRSINESEKYLSKEYKRTAERLIKELQRLYTEALTNPDILNSHRYEYDKYYQMVVQIEKELNKLGINETNYLNHSFKKLYKENIKLLGQQFPIGNSLNAEIIDSVINAYWVNDGMNWSGRIWRDKKALAQKLQQGMVDTLATGRTPDELVKTLMKDFGVTYNNAKRIVETELCHIQTESTLQKYKDAGLTQYRFLTARDERVCEECGPLDNQVFDLASIQYGVNAPPIHPRCRCCVLGVVNIKQEKT